MHFLKVFLKCVFWMYFSPVYDNGSDQPIIWVREMDESESGQMVLKKVKWTYFNAYLWQTMWNHAKKSMEGSKLSDSVFSQWDVRSSLLKTLKTRQTKTPVSQFFQILWPIQDGTMSKSMARAFQICITHRGGDDFTLSYRPSKSTQISVLKKAEMSRSKKKTRPQFSKLMLQIESAWN